MKTTETLSYNLASGVAYIGAFAVSADDAWSYAGAMVAGRLSF